VDFDPVRAKAEGRPTRLPAEISDLFPDSFEDSELGQIPSGWKISNLGSLIKQCGEPIQASSATSELPYVPIDCISSKSLSLREYKSGAEANTSLVLFREGDLLFGAMRPYFHKVCIAPFDGTTRTTCFALRPFTDSHYAFVAMLLSAASTIEYATLHSTGSTIPYIRWSNGLENMLSIQPPDPILDCFNKTALPILRKISISLFTERPIAAVRDILLPKLISGEIRIPDAEKMLEEVGV
jgi:type I restriction enzyme, S subunit